MFHKPKVPDRQILQKVTAQLPRRGIRPPCDVHVAVQNGTVTLTGKIEFDLQRKAAIHAASAVNGVMRVVDQMAVMHNTIGGWQERSSGLHIKSTASHPHTAPASHPHKNPATPEGSVQGTNAADTATAAPAGVPAEDKKG